MYLQSSIMSQISRKNSFGKVVFPFLVGNFMSQNRNWFFGRHFVIVYPIFDFFAVFWFFWITSSVARISTPNSFGKVLSWVRVHRDPPLTTNGSAERLDHLSVIRYFFTKTSFSKQFKDVVSRTNRFNHQTDRMRSWDYILSTFWHGGRPMLLRPSPSTFFPMGENKKKRRMC